MRKACWIWWNRFRGTGITVRFIEYMDVGNRNDWREQLVVPSRDLQARIHARWPLRPVRPDYAGEVARRYAFEDGQGEVGFISSVTQPFCGACSRARLSSDGSFYTCLFAQKGTDLRGAAARRRRRRRDDAHHPRRLERPRGPLQRAAHGVARNEPTQPRRLK